MDWLLILQIVISAILVTLILVQTPSSSLGSAFGGSSVHQHTRKGAEKFIFTLTIIASVLFVAISLANIIL